MLSTGAARGASRFSLARARLRSRRERRLANAPRPAQSSERWAPRGGSGRVRRAGAGGGGRAHGRRGGPALLRDRAPGVLVRRGQHRAARAALAGQDARPPPAQRVHAAAVLLRGVGVGAGVGRRRGRPALPVGGGRGARGPGRLRHGRPLHDPPRRPHRGRAHRMQPAADLVLAGGALLLPARPPHGAITAGVRPCAADPDTAHPGPVGDRVGARPGHALLRGGDRRARGGVAARAAAPARGGPGRRGHRRRGRPGADPARHLPERHRARQLDRLGLPRACACARSSPSS